MTSHRVSISYLVAGVLVLLFAPVAGCRHENPSPQSRSSTSDRRPVDYPGGIYDVLSIDSELGILRNEATRSMPLSEAIRGYVASMDSLDFGSCPEDFRAAFQDHADAWRESIPFFERFPGLRGEMHVLFDEIRGRDAETRAELERVESRIWDSWREVEAVAADHGAIEPPGGD